MVPEQTKGPTASRKKQLRIEAACCCKQPPRSSSSGSRLLLLGVREEGIWGQSI